MNSYSISTPAKRAEKPTSPERRRVLIGAGAAMLLGACSGMNPRGASAARHDIAYMSDVHFHDVYAKFADGSFKGLPSANGKYATIRTMRSQLTSTRLFNENYFAFIAALDDGAPADARLGGSIAAALAGAAAGVRAVRVHDVREHRLPVGRVVDAADVFLGQTRFPLLGFEHDHVGSVL